MKDAPARTIRLADYRPPSHLVDSVELTFDLDPEATRVKSRIRFRPNPAAPGPFTLHGEDLDLIAARIDGQPVSPTFIDEGLRCEVPDRPFTWEAEVEISPIRNTALEGLYISNGLYCTQCEAEGFRRITFYPDRPDVMAPFRVRINSELPVRLSNGNLVAEGEGWSEWHDPWPKPAYLFALVAGRLVARRGRFVTRSGREVALNVWVRPGDLDKTAFAMDSLVRAMRWDEEKYGREYDLDIFNIVAVDDFNMGAMENKGLNIFNASAVLASPDTATDENFERIEAIIAHEYFHNWTGNRITCRDWFQLCLKEGLTVFRDAEFTADMRSAAVKRIADVIDLRARQFPEDQGPLAHPVRPDHYQEINNFYTATVYEKGAEVIGMLRRLVGDEAYRRAMDLWFTRHDGQACTVEDWLKVFEDATGRDLTQFKRWYTQAGTPRLSVAEAWSPETGRHTLTFRQHTPPTPGQAEKLPQVLPIAVGLLSPNGSEVVPTTLLEMTEPEQSFSFEGLPARPVASILRGFSAPVVLERDVPPEDLEILLQHDTDPFNRWEAGQRIKRRVIEDALAGGEAEIAPLEGLGPVLADEGLDPAFRALMLALPGAAEVAEALHEAGRLPDPAAIHAAREAVRRALARRFEPLLEQIHASIRPSGPYSPDADQAGRRALANAALALLSLRDGGARARAQFASADNMTDSLAALGQLVAADRAEAELAAFHDRWKAERLVMDKWFAIQVRNAPPGRAVEVAEGLASHPDFAWKNPNRFRSVFGALAANFAGFHRADGAGYRLLADWLIRLDAVNPQVAARMSQAFQTWRWFDAERQAHARAALARIAATPGLSRDTTEMVSRLLGEAA